MFVFITITLNPIFFKLHQLVKEIEPIRLKSLGSSSIIKLKNSIKGSDIFFWIPFSQKTKKKLKIHKSLIVLILIEVTQSLKIYFSHVKKKKSI